VRNLDFKNSVRCATTTVLPACTPSGTGSTHILTGDVVGAFAAVDGVTMIANERILVKDQAAQDDNGIYDLTVVGDGATEFVLTRSADADSDAEVTSGLAVHVNEGTANADTDWYLTTNDPITLDTTALTFALNSRLPSANEKAGLSVNSPTAANPVQTLAQIYARSTKAPCRAGTTAPLAACTPAGTGLTHTLTGDAVGSINPIDGVTLLVGERLLVQDQVAGDDNGIYTVTVVGDGATAFVLTRAVDAALDAQVVSGMTVAVQEGTTNADKVFMLTTNGAIVVDTTALVFGIAAYLPAASSYVGHYQATVTHAEYIAAAQSENYALPAFPANSLILGGHVQLVTDFSGGGTASAVVELGDAGNTDELASSVNVFTGAGAAHKAGLQTAFIGMEPAYAPVARMTVDGAHTCADLAAGEMIVHIYYVAFP
jgi:hypothetical protein